MRKFWFFWVSVLLVVAPVWAQTLDPAVREGLGVLLQDEYRARALYQRVLDEQGTVMPFAHIVQAEARHAAALEQVFGRYGIEVPAPQWNPQNVPTYATRQEACTAAAEAERENVALYDRYLALELPADIRPVFEALRAASADRHLFAFTRCAEGRGMGGGMRGSPGRHGRRGF